MGDIMEMVSFKVENGESEKITRDAYAHGMNKSEYLRFLIELIAIPILAFTKLVKGKK